MFKSTREFVDLFRCSPKRDFPEVPYNATWMATFYRRQKKPGTLKVSGIHSLLNFFFYLHYHNYVLTHTK